MLQKNVTPLAPQNHTCNCQTQDVFAEKYLNKSIAKLDINSLQECPFKLSIQEHLENTKNNLTVCETTCESPYIKVLSALDYSLIGAEVLFERYYEDPVEQCIFDSDYTIVKSEYYSIEKQTNRIKEMAANLASTHHYGKNKNLNFDHIWKMYEDKIVSLWHSQTTQIFAAVDFAGALSGFISLKENKDCLEINLLAVHASIRRKGIAQELVKKACFYAQGLQKNIYVTTQAEHIPAIRLYEKAGFLQKNFKLIYHKIKES